jgi:hypothetical protein
MIRPLLILTVLLSGTFAWSAPYESKVRKIDTAVMAVDNDIHNFVLTTQENCQPDYCVKTLTYRGGEGTIRKVIEEIRSKGEPGSITGRYYTDCKLILSRVAPLDPGKAKDPMNISKYYFDDGELLRITFGGEIRTFSPDQTEYYARTYDVSAENCRPE